MTRWRAKKENKFGECLENLNQKEYQKNGSNKELNWKRFWDQTWKQSKELMIWEENISSKFGSPWKEEWNVISAEKKRWVLVICFVSVKN